MTENHLSRSRSVETSRSQLPEQDHRLHASVISSSSRTPRVSNFLRKIQSCLGLANCYLSATHMIDGPVPAIGGIRN